MNELGQLFQLLVSLPGGAIVVSFILGFYVCWKWVATPLKDAAEKATTDHNQLLVDNLNFWKELAQERERS